MGTIYLIHFHTPYKHAHHYLGYVNGGTGSVTRRLNRHRKGNGSKLMSVIMKNGIEWTHVRSWENVDRSYERKLKNRGSSKRLCPICKKNKG